MIPPPVCILYSQDPDLVRRIKAFLRAPRRKCATSVGPDRLEAVLQQTGPALLLLDLRAKEARDLLEQIQAGWPEILIVALGTPRSEPLREAEQAGIYAAEDVQIDRRRFQALVSRAFDHLRVLQENRELREQVDRARRSPDRAIASRRSPSARAATLPLLRFPRVFRRFDNVETLLASVVESWPTPRGSAGSVFSPRSDRARRYRLRAGLRCLPETHEIEYRRARSVGALVRVACASHLPRTSRRRALDQTQRSLLRRALDTFGAEVIVPLHARGRISGWLFFGHRVTGERFDYEISKA